MGVEVAGACWSSQSLFHHHHHHHQSTFHISPLFRVDSIRRTRSVEIHNRGVRRKVHQPLQRAFSANWDGFEDNDDSKEEEFLDRLHELAIRIKDSESRFVEEIDDACSSSSGFELSADRSVERKASSVDLPLSLRMLKKQRRLRIGEAAGDSVMKAFSSMVFIIRELHSYTLQMREFLFVENLEGILTRVHGEMHASFVWLFQHIFSCTPTLMLSLMLLLANFTVHSTAAIAAPSPPPSQTSEISVADNLPSDQYHHQKQQQQQPRMLRFESFEKFSAVGGGGGGGSTRHVAGSTDDDRSDSTSNQSRAIVHEGIPTVPSTAAEEEEERLWESVVQEAACMQAAEGRDEALMDPETLRRLVSPVVAELEGEDQLLHMHTEVMYQRALSQDPDNSLLLSNFAQFLYVVLHDHNRAEQYFKRAVAIKPVDAESFSRYANFLWLARNDIEAAEEAYLEAIAAAETGDSYHAASYAHFLWNTGGEDTCYPLDG